MTPCYYTLRRQAQKNVVKNQTGIKNSLEYRFLFFAGYVIDFFAPPQKPREYPAAR
ncbi:MAG: hypothetical protein LBP26_07765 [Clostridiales bacterium]|nr:hypothetical protein [Clostridiales bacterium]